MRDNYVAIMDGTRYFCELAEKYPLLTAEEEIILGRKVQNGNEHSRNYAVKKLVEHNLRLVAYIAFKYIRRGIDKEELISQGYNALIRAARKYNPDHKTKHKKGVKFSSFACWIIRNEICMAFRKRKNSKKLKARSLDAFLRGLNDTTLKERTEDKKADNPADLASERDISKYLHRILKTTLNEKQYDILVRYYGSNGNNGRGERLEDIGETYKISRERIRQIKEDALNKLKEEISREAVLC